MKRRSFLTSIIAALAMSPLLCRMAKGIGVSLPPLEELGVEEMESSWGGTLSSNFCARYFGNSAVGVRAPDGSIQWTDPVPKPVQPSTDDKIKTWGVMPECPNTLPPMTTCLEIRPSNAELTPGTFEQSLFDQC